MNFKCFGVRLRERAREKAREREREREKAWVEG